MFKAGPTLTSLMIHAQTQEIPVSEFKQYGFPGLVVLMLFLIIIFAGKWALNQYSDESEAWRNTVIKLSNDHRDERTEWREAQKEDQEKWRETVNKLEDSTTGLKKSIDDLPQHLEDHLLHLEQHYEDRHKDGEHA